MLLFITGEAPYKRTYVKFQYISCYCLSTSSRCPILVFYHFNTSHVTVYQEIQKHKGTCNVISIHLMLLFIRFIIPPPFLTGDFNTSHVTVYQEILLESQYQLSNFNTSHVTVYHRLSLSIIHFIKNFNTSHVTVYPIHFFMYRDNFKFQYISCYCLSIIANMNVESTLLFQYISCYCLSELLKRNMDDRRNFNTSHVTVYLKRDDCDFCSTIFQYISCYCLSFCSLPPFSVGVDFNTSHVTVYLIRSHIIINSIYISIHLMLLFI